MRTVGIEEELLIVASADGAPLATGPAVVDTAVVGTVDDPSVDSASQFEREFKKEQAELGSIPSVEIDELRNNLQELRSQMMKAAAEHDSQVAALATNPFKVRPTSSGGDRYERMGREFGLVARQQLTCGQHVHVSINSRAEGVAVLDRIRPWLPWVTALSANSPFWQGEDTGYASYRGIVWGQWPTAGPSDLFLDERGYDEAIAELIRSGAALDDGMLYFDARLSARYPTVEVRVADVCTSVEDALLVAAIVRGLVSTEANRWREQRPPLQIRSGLLRAAQWRASRFGMTGELVDLAHPGKSGSLIDSWVMAENVLDHIRTALISTGDLDFVESALTAIHHDGTGAEWQRRAFAAGGSVADVVRDAVRRTTQ